MGREGVSAFAWFSYQLETVAAVPSLIAAESADDDTVFGLQSGENFDL